jgi:hypothetical protein
VLERLLFFALIPALGELQKPPAPPPAPAISATMDCRVDAGTGRLVCAVEVTPPAGETLTWSDALVVSAPSRAKPLRSRVSGSGRPPRRIELGFLLGPGEGGRIEVRARAVTCPVARAGERTAECRPSSRLVGYEVPSG